MVGSCSLLAAAPGFVPKGYVAGNTKINDMVSKAESEQNDYRREYPINVFFSPEKHHFYWFSNKDTGWTTSVYVRNGLVLVGTSALMLVLLGYILRRQLNRTGA